MPILISQVRSYLNWQWPGITMQYQRLIERSRQPMEVRLAEHMETVADMDFLVTAIQRFLRTANLALRISSENRPQLSVAKRIFESKWRASLTEIRNALEHVENPGAGFPVPAIGIPRDGSDDGEFILMGRRGNLDLPKLYEDAEKIAKAISSVVGPWTPVPTAVAADPEALPT
jgi:hypothetical protein